MITLEQCERILNKGIQKYNKEEVKQIKEYLYFIGEIETNNYIN